MAQQRQRRALSGAREGGRIRRGGDGEAAARLARALDAAPEHPEVQDQLTHGVHSWPARLHPATARELVKLVTSSRAGEGGGGPLLADPFCGSGTVLVEAMRAGIPCLGVDANPLAVLVARAKTWSAPPARRAELRRVGRELSRAAWEEGKAARRAGWEAPPRRAPAGADRARRDKLLHDWFAPHVRAELEFLAAAIDDLAGGDAELADLLRVPLSAILHKVSFRASDTDPRRTERRIARGAAARLFGDRIEQLCDGLDELARDRRPPPARVELGDARALDRAGVTAGALSAAVTSPPYGGTYDYADQHRLRLEFLGLPAATLERAEIGSRRSFRGPAPARARALEQWQRGLRAAFTSLAHSLAPGALAAVVLGDSLAGDSPLHADDLLEATRTDRLSVVAFAAQERRPLGAVEHRAFHRRRKQEWIFLLQRVGS